MNETKEPTKRCLSCDKDISAKAKRCPYCRQDLRSWFRRHPILTALGIILITPIAIAGMFGSSAPSQNESTSAQNIESKTDSYQSYDGNTYTYEVLYQESDNRYAATFTPFLPKDDRNLVEATLQVFKTTYGNDAQIDPQPSIEERDGRNVIKFRADNGNYYVLPVKEDTGQINSLVYWKE